MDKRLVDRDKQGRSMQSDWVSVAGQRERFSSNSEDIAMEQITVSMFVLTFNSHICEACVCKHGTCYLSPQKAIPSKREARQSCELSIEAKI